LGPISGELRPDDVQVLNFIQEKGGKVLEPEIRTRFALPKTSAWRQIKRLERLGYVKVTKIGSQNQIEILRQRDLGA
ncbi:MAG: winged helix DNA-binding protein, partial [Thaumarchaeota archaeon]|nr:winged helix DNA-binding protein [Nitrososphaerota archaeon]